MLQVGPMEQKNDQSALPNELSDTKPIAETKSDEVGPLLLISLYLACCMHVYVHLSLSIGMYRL